MQTHKIVAHMTVVCNFNTQSASWNMAWLRLTCSMETPVKDCLNFRCQGLLELQAACFLSSVCWSLFQWLSFFERHAARPPIFCVRCCLLHCACVNGNTSFLTFRMSWLEPFLETAVEHSWAVNNKCPWGIRSKTFLVKFCSRLHVCFNIQTKHQRHPLHNIAETCVIQRKSLLEPF
jgi:hypothetical protein